MSQSQCRAWRCEQAPVALGFCMRHYRQHRRGLDPTQPRPEIGDRIDEGTYGVLETSEDGERVRCHICGQWFRSVGSHAALTHGVDSRTYRERYGLPRLLPLTSPALSRARSEDSKSRVGSAGWARFEEARDPQAASDARVFTDPSPVTVRGRAGRIAAVTPQVVAAARFCEVCGARLTGRARTCSDKCLAALKARATRRHWEELRATRPSEEEKRELIAAEGTDQLRAVVERLQRDGVPSRQIGKALGRSQAWMARHFPRRRAGR